MRYMIKEYCVFHFLFIAEAAALRSEQSWGPQPKAETC